MIRAVIDTNVPVSGLLTPAGNEALILPAIHQGPVRPFFSAYILKEFIKQKVEREGWGSLGVCRRKIEMAPGAQSRDDTPAGGGPDEPDLDCIPAVKLSGAIDCLAGSG